MSHGLTLTSRPCEWKKGSFTGVLWLLLKLGAVDVSCLWGRGEQKWRICWMHSGCQPAVSLEHVLIVLLSVQADDEHTLYAGTQMSMVMVVSME